MVWIFGKFCYTQLLINEYGNIFDGKLNVINYNRTVMKLHDSGSNFFLIHADFSMLGYGCGVSQYSKFI